MVNGVGAVAVVGPARSLSPVGMTGPAGASASAAAPSAFFGAPPAELARAPGLVAELRPVASVVVGPVKGGRDRKGTPGRES